MKVAIIAGEIPTTTFIERLVSGLGRKGTEVLVFGNILKPPKPLAGVQYIGYKKQTGAFSAYMFAIKYTLLLSLFKRHEKRRLSELLKDRPNALLANAQAYAILWHHPDIIHVQWAKGIERFSWVQQFGIKLLLSLRGAHINYSPVADAELAEQYRKTFPTIDGFHGVSKAICKEAGIYGADANKCKVVYSGFDLIQFPKSNFQNDFDTLKKRPIKIISVGRSHWKKGYHFALDAMAILKQRELPFTYTIIGAAGSEELMFQRDQLDLNASVTFLGNVPFEVVKQHIREADVLLLPSVEEGIANVVLEATLLGSLVVTTDCGGMVESVENEKTGFVVPIRNVEAIANSIQRIKESDPEFLAAIVDAAYIRTASQHNEDKMVADMLELYKSVLT